MPDERFPAGRPRPGDRGGFERPPFERPRFPRPAPAGPPGGAGPGLLHSLRVRDGEREIEVSGSAIFVRQAIDDLPQILARLRGEAPPRPASISMPAPARTETAAPAGVTDAVEAAAMADVAVAGKPVPAGELPRDSAPRVRKHANGNGRKAAVSLEDAILDVLRDERRPLAVAAIRERLDQDVTAQQVRRTLERSTAVVASNDRPATYRLRRG